MISIIICSRYSDISEELEKNIQDTIDFEYELVVINNSDNRYSIFSAYNEGVRRAKGDILCFMHEDILYHTQGWGIKVIEHFQDIKVGLIGVVGGHYLPDCPASWWSTECRSGVILQGICENKQEYYYKNENWIRYRENLSNSISVVTVDGLWFSIPKKLFEKIRFDELTFSGFHCYDLDICMQIHKLGLDIHVIFDVLIEHFSGGNHDQNLIKQREVFFEKWTHSLPIIKGIELSKIEIEDRRFFVDSLHSLTKEYWRSQDEINRILNSKAYRLGKFILKPFSLIRHKWVQIFGDSQ